MKIAAVFGDVNHKEAYSCVSKMCEAQRAHEWHASEIFTVPGGVIGVVKTSECYGTIPMLYKNKSDNILAISGVPIKEGKLKKYLKSVVEMSLNEASSALMDLDGAYAALFWDDTEKMLLLVHDFMGFQPIYFYRGNKRIAISSDIKSFAVSGVVAPIPDLTGWSAFLSFGHTIGDNTQLKQVYRLRGEKLSYSPIKNELKKENYWEWPDRNPKMSIDEIDLDKILNSYRKDIESYHEYGLDVTTLLMSSGFDSRLLLCLLSESGFPIKTLSVQQRGHYLGAEGKIGYKIAKDFGITDSSIVEPLNNDESEILKLKYMLMNDVATPSLSLHIMRVANVVSNLSGAVWDGYSPGFTLHFNEENRESYLRKYHPDSNNDFWNICKSIYVDSVVEEMQFNLADTIIKEFEKYGNDDYAVFRFISKNRGLCRIAPNPLKVYSNSVLPFTPGMNRLYWEFVSQIPPQKVIAEMKLFKKIFLEKYHRAMIHPICNEKGLRMINNHFSFKVFIYNLLYEFAYKWERRHKFPVVGQFIHRKRKVVPNQRKQSLVNSVLKRVEIDDHHLKADSVRRLLSKSTLSPEEVKCRNILFYKSLWELMMRGQITTLNANQYL